MNLFYFKEPYMEVVNPFILKNKERMVVYLDQLSNIGEPSFPHQFGSTINANIDTGMIKYFLGHII